MTAASAAADTAKRSEIVQAVWLKYAKHVSSELVRDVLLGYPASPGNMTRIGFAAGACGVDIKTVAERSPVEIQARQDSRRPPCRSCRDKEAQIESLQAELGAHEHRQRRPRNGGGIGP